MSGVLKPVQHYLMHIPYMIEKQGVLKAYSGRSMERTIGRYKKLIKSNRVVFTGYIFGEKLNEVYSHAGMYVLSSYNEGFPLVLLEAMSYQLDVLVSDIPATHLIDLKESDYFKPGDVHDLACHLQQKLATPQKRTYNLSAFDWNKIAEKVAEVYRGCVSPR